VILFEKDCGLLINMEEEAGATNSKPYSQWVLRCCWLPHHYTN